MMTLLLLTFGWTSSALVTPSGCGDQQAATWVRALLRPGLARATETMSAPNAPLLGPNLRLAFERHLNKCDESANGAERQALTKQLAEVERAAVQELKTLAENRPRALERCAGPTREACVADVTEAFRLREHALRTSTEARRQDLERQRQLLMLSFPEARKTVDGFDVLDAFAKAFAAKLGARPGATLRAITVETGLEFTSSWQMVMDIRFEDHNFEYLNRVFVNLYDHVTRATIAQVQTLAATQALSEPARVATVNSGTLEEALADRRAGRDVTWLTKGRGDAGQVGVIDLAIVKTLKAGLRP